MKPSARSCARSGDRHNRDVGTGGTIGVGTGGTIEMWAQAVQSGENYDRTGVLAEYGF